MKNKHFIYVPIILAYLLFIPGCKPGDKNLFPAESRIIGLASPIKLGIDTTIVYLSDYFFDNDLEAIDSIVGGRGLKFNRISSEELLIINRLDESVHVSEMIVWVKGEPYSFFVESPQKQLVEFEFDPVDDKYREVNLAGDINDWDPSKTPLEFSDGVWKTSLWLNPGRYQYQIVTDSEWILDPHNDEIVDNNIGGYNSLLIVPQTDKELLPHLYSNTFDHRGNLSIRFENNPDNILVFWQNHRLPVESLTREGNLKHVEIPADAKRHERSFLRVRACNEYGASNDLLIPLHKDKPVDNPALLTRHDYEAAILYFIMVDRFYNGKPELDDPVDDPEVAPRANFHGGDLAGIAEKIRDGYFEKLGINSIWFSPITQNPLEAFTEYPYPHRKYTGYHGYWPITLTTVDHRFGNEEIMRDMVETAHKNDINVLLDFVSNHVHEQNPLIIENPDWATDLVLPDGSKNIRIWDEQRLTTWFDTFLPSLDFSIPEVTETMSDSALFWIQEYNLDGFRHDATKHIPLEFWRVLTGKLKENVVAAEDRRLFQIGETFGSRELIGDYVGSGLLDGQFDFNLYFDARSIFALDEGSFKDLDNSLLESFNHYGYNNLMGNITGNHDLPRFISLAGGALAFDEDDKEAGWQKKVGVGDPSGYDKLSSLTAFIMTIPGVPVIYYGDEIGMPGAGDPDSRRPMRFENLSEREKHTKEKVKKLTRIRSNNLAFIYGDFNTIEVSDKTYAYGRSYFDNHGIVVFNKSREEKEVTFELPEKYQNVKFENHFGNDFHLKDNYITVNLKPLSYEILTGK